MIRVKNTLAGRVAFLSVVTVEKGFATQMHTAQRTGIGMHALGAHAPNSRISITRKYTVWNCKSE